MPSTRPRYTLTETPDLVEALDAAGEAWPELRGDRPALLRRLIETGHATVARNSEQRIAERRQAIRQAAGAATGAYPLMATEAVKSEWPE